MRTARIEAFPPLNCQDCQFCGFQISVDDFTNCEIYGRVNVSEAEECPSYEED